MNNLFVHANHFMYQNARPLDMARWQYHFEKGEKEAVLKALSFYQNDDGGFGHALEPDSWNPNSTPIQTWAATEILREIHFTDQNHPSIRGILDYLDSGRDFNGTFWYNTVQSNNDYPHAPWWHTGSTSTSHTDYNPTACLAGFILCFAEKKSNLFQLGSRIAGEAIDHFLASPNQHDMHTLACYIRLLQYIIQSEEPDLFNTQGLQNKLLADVPNCINSDFARWEQDYICKPSHFFNTKNSVFYKDNHQTAAYECDYIAKTQLSDGSWPIPWGWEAFPEEWAISKNWWKAGGIIKNLLYLKGFGKL